MYQNLALCEEDVTPWHWSPAGGLLDGDRWNYHRQLMDDGNPHLHINDSWVGTATGPKTITVTYTATVKDKYVAGSGSAPAAIGTATAKYVLTLHDECEETGRDTVNVNAPPVALWGSGGTGNLAAKVSGEKKKGMQEALAGSAKAWSWAIGGGFDISVLKVKELFGLGASVSGQYGEETNIERSQTAILDRDVAEDEYVYAALEVGYVRQYVFFRHFLPEGEHKLNTDWGHRVWKDTAGVAEVKWVGPFIENGPGMTPYPTYNGDESPPLPGNPDGE